ncbi:hypothetical protein SAMN02745121_06195 [Nannocystis exedens]|uniref:Uncharacterized protein n=1 Tax=Nannocystis exedens TaxID=54 RepID=A0A1I2EPM4_9BACT|nr:hypothetical protein [Nannocystis exedens]SFE94789.1 hypothetical protein SAMN02745121_06195 [Nannocystis exedens]
MPPAPHEVLAAVAPHLPAALVEPARLQAIAGWSRRLPPAFNWLGFECRLAEADPRIDFAGCCEAWDGGRARLLDALARDPALSGPGPAALVRAWPVEHVLQDSPSVWLEFDFVGDGPPAAFAFLCLDPACANTFRAHRGAERPPLDRLIAAAERGATLLLGHAPSAMCIDSLRRAVLALPASGRALHVAATPHRGGDDLRVHCALLARDVPAWLRRIGWPGDLATAERALAVIGDEFRQVGVQLAVGEALRPALGLEAYVSRGPEDFPAWRQTFAALAAEGACDPAKAHALLGDWWGHTTVSLPGAPWRVAVHRQFYVKLVVDGARLQAKAYLAIFPRYTLL